MRLHRFDLMTRRLATARDRRSVLRTTASIVAFALTGLHRKAIAQEACPEGCVEGDVCTAGVCMTPCDNHRDCRSKHDDPCVSNTCLEGFCNSTIIECLPGHECCEGECCPTSCDFDVDCTILDPCWWGRCGVNGQCEFTEIDPCHVCATDQDCIDSGPNTVCCDGACRRPCPSGMVMGKGCECQATGSATLDGVVVVDDASG
jgi:hypothetical protein